MAQTKAQLVDYGTAVASSVPTNGPYLSAANTVAISTNGVQRVTVDSSGRLLVGTSSVSADSTVVLQGRSSSASASAVLRVNVGTATPANNDALGYVVFGDSSSSDTAYLWAQRDGGTWSASSKPTRLVFSTTADGASSPTEAMRINNQREVLIGTNTRTANGGVLQVSNGVTFPATQSACSDANTLDDYEEGSFTPVVVGTTTAGTAIYNNAAGRYTKVGRVVHVQLYVDWYAGTGTGFLRIDGLPFTASSAAIYPAFAVGEVSNIALNANCILATRVQISTSTLPVTQLPAGGGGAASVAYDSSGYIVTGGSYIVD